MVNEHALTVSLEEFGLSQYEAQAYVALISKGTISASDLAYYSDLPRTKVYPTLLKLENKKLVIISKSKPIMCTAIAPEDAFDPIIHEQINKVNAMNTLVSKLKKASEENRKSRGSEEKRYYQLSASNVQSQLQTMIDGSKSSLQITVDQWGLGLLSECKEQLLSVIRRNLDGEILEFEFIDEKITDTKTKSEWNYDGIAISGSLEGAKLTRISIEPGFWFEWAAFHPDTVLYGDDRN